MVSFLDPANVVPVPRDWKTFMDVDVWAEEAIFGHRLWSRQTAWLLFLEFLNVAEAHHREGNLLVPTAPDVATKYRLRYRMGLRNVLFNNHRLGRIAELRHSDAERWRMWREEMPTLGAPAGGYGYLEERFGKFDDFAEVVSLVRRTAVEPESNRRWTSRFVFPFGRDAIFSDAKLSGKGVPERDYNNFGRTGEMLYLMLSRSSQAAKLAERLLPFFDPKQGKNKIVALLSAPGDDDGDQLQLGQTYLPYRAHPAFDRLADDWSRVFDLDLPAQDAFGYLAPLGTLHVLLYQLETAAAVLGKDRPPIVCEMISPRRELVRQRSIASFYDNDALSARAVEAEADRFFASPGWSALAGPSTMSEDERVEAGADLLAARYKFSGQAGASSSLSKLRRAFSDALERKHSENWGDVHSSYGRHVGLVSRRATNRYRYAPTDELLRTLVVARVGRRVEFGRFLEDLYAQYRLVFGPVEAQQAVAADAFDASIFERNRERLELRLGSMGLLKRLSDGCAYVTNPFARRVGR